MRRSYVTAALVAALVLGGCAADAARPGAVPPPSAAARPLATDPPAAVRCDRLLAAFAAVAAAAPHLAVASVPANDSDEAALRSLTDALVAAVPPELRADTLAYTSALLDDARRLDDLRRSGASPDQLAGAASIVDTDAVRRAGDHLDAYVAASCPG